MCKVKFLRIENADIIHTCNWFGKDGIRFVMVKYEKTNTPIKRHEWERSCQIVVDNTALLVCKRAEAEDVGNGLVLVVGDEVRARWEWVILNANFAR